VRLMVYGLPFSTHLSCNQFTFILCPFKCVLKVDRVLIFLLIFFFKSLKLGSCLSRHQMVCWYIVALALGFGNALGYLKG
jgi:hypothetical protein